MKSLRSTISLSLISLNILVIMLISLSSVLGFFQIDSEWESGLTTDITAALNNALLKKFPDINSITELKEEEIFSLSEEALEDHKGRLREIFFYTESDELVYQQNITDSFDKPSEKKIKPELIKWASEIRHLLSSPHPTIGILTNAEKQPIGKVQIRSVPFTGLKYTVYFDQIITRSFFIGIIFALIISVIISIIISRKLSHSSRIFADQLSKLADGERKINFTQGTTFEMQSSTDAAKSLQSQLKHNEQMQLRKLQDIIHDLKTPVAALGIQFEAIDDGVLKLDNERIKLLSSEFGRIEEIIAELSRYTKLSSEDYVPNSEIFDLNILISESIERFRLQTQKKEQTMLFDKPNMPSMIETDKLGIMRVLNNLAINASNNAPGNSEIKISVRNKKRMIDESKLFIIEIENAGHIDNTDFSLIFDRLYRSKRSGYHGSGLGLAISKTIVEKNGGKISAMNTAFDTVIFRIELPAALG